eukprot:gene2275-2615_t
MEHLISVANSSGSINAAIEVLVYQDRKPDAEDHSLTAIITMMIAKPANELHRLTKKLTVSVEGEAGLDAGAVSAEFFMVLLHQLKKRLFIGVAEQIIPIKDRLKCLLFQLAGMIVAHSMKLGGPAFPCLNTGVYYYIAGKRQDLQACLQLPVMKWSRKHDCIFIRELLLFEPWKHRKGTPEGVEVWERIAESLEQVEEFKFKTDKRSVRDRFNKLIKDHKKEDRDEQRASGMSPGQDEVDSALDNIVPMVEEAEKKQDQPNDGKMKKHKEEQGKAIQMRRRNHITQEEKSELIRKHKKKLLVEITIFDQLGVDCGSILIDEDNRLSYYGSRRGMACINSSNKIDSEFRKYFARRGDVATRAINGSPKVEASEVDVLITFREEEYEEMMAGYVWCFTPDALWVIRNGSGGAIVATFTSSSKKFWLFHFERKLQDLNSIEQRQSIPGYWLQQVKGQLCQVLTERAVIKHINIIKKTNGEVMACSIPEKNSTWKALIDKKFILNVKI